jgi:hypothetical protein
MGGDSDIALSNLGAWRQEKTGYYGQFPEIAQTDDMNNHDDPKSQTRAFSGNCPSRCGMNFFWKVKSRVSLSHRELSFVGLLKACPGGVRLSAAR